MPPSKQDQTGPIVRLDIPPDHHPAVVRGDGPGARLGRETLAGIYEAYGKINDVADKVRDKGRLATATQPYAERAIAMAGRAVATLTKQVAHLDTEIAGALKPTVEPGLAVQIRSHWAASNGQLSGLQKVIEGGDVATASAVLSAPAYLSGLSDANQGVLRLMAASKFAPDHVARRAETADALARVERASAHFTETIAGRLREWRDDDARLIQEALQS